MDLAILETPSVVGCSQRQTDPRYAKKIKTTTNISLNMRLTPTRHLDTIHRDTMKLVLMEKQPLDRNE